MYILILLNRGMYPYSQYPYDYHILSMRILSYHHSPQYPCVCRSRLHTLGRDEAEGVLGSMIYEMH